MVPYPFSRIFFNFCHITPLDKGSKLDEKKMCPNIKLFIWFSLIIPNFQDETLRRIIEKYGCDDWKYIASFFPDRSEMQCYHRWQKALNPDLVKGPWTKEVCPVCLKCFPPKTQGNNSKCDKIKRYPISIITGMSVTIIYHLRYESTNISVWCASLKKRK